MVAGISHLSLLFVIAFLLFPVVTDMSCFVPEGHNYIKDLALVASMVIAVGGCWLAYVQNRYSQSHLKKVMKDLDNLQKAEDALTSLQTKSVIKPLNICYIFKKYIFLR